MGYEPLVQQNPLRVLNMGRENNQMGLVMARAGLGKTALLVQIALDAILRGKRVIHVSVGESIDKTRKWYDDILQSILQEHSVTRPHELMDMVARHRMIMTFKVAAFSRSRLEERLNDLILQDIFRPNVLIVDGFDFDGTSREALEDIKDLMDNMNMQAWFSAICHRGDQRVSPAGVPAPCHEIDDLFDMIILLKPEKDATIQLDIIRNYGEVVEGGTGLRLDPTTMMVKEL
ncbi:AAA family ATPase [uncultured Desulfobulbus sp.]|uniref:AAA family ATPase n=1 Tax=uncultured Desulfobulbus sp. TaxID=239745 RepID=UPI00260CDD5B|nr:AAA family ATPase [uncultured Desulfobulbus sp.]